MYCRNCGNDVDDKAIACPKCGVNPKSEKKFCPSCGVATAENQVMCVACGTSFPTSNSFGMTQDDGKTIAIIAHITFIGTIVAIIMNNQNKTEFGSFYVRQMVGLLICNIIASFAALCLVGYAVLLFNFVIWIISLVNAINNTTKPVPIYGPLFQKWFKGL